MDVEIQNSGKIEGEIEVPGDKSITHRALIFGAICKGDVTVYNPLKSQDCKATVDCLRKLGVEIIQKEEKFTVKGRGGEFEEPDDVLDCGNSGTTMRILSGLLASQKFYSILTGDDSLRKRPMRRIIEPLRLMGAKIFGRSNDNFPPITIIGNELRSVIYKLPVASAQVKSCLILASLFAEGTSEIEEPGISRDHTERMVKYLSGKIEKRGRKIFVSGKQSLEGKEIFVPGDFSSASFFITLAALIKNSYIKIKNLGLNPTRTGFLEVIKRMGVKFRISNLRQMNNEPVGELEVWGSEKMKGTKIDKNEIPLLIDEIPLISLISCFCDGETEITGAKELRFKESDRLKAINSELTKMGADITEMEDGLIIKGIKKLKGAELNSWNDHRIAMMLTIAGCVADGKTVVRNVDCVDVSFPEFFNLLGKLGVKFRIIK